MRTGMDDTCSNEYEMCAREKEIKKQNKIKENIISKKCEQKIKIHGILRKFQREKENSRIVFGLRQKKIVVTLLRVGSKNTFGPSLCSWYFTVDTFRTLI